MYLYTYLYIHLFLEFLIEYVHGISNSARYPSLFSELLVWKALKVQLLFRHIVLYLADLELYCTVVLAVKFLSVTRSVSNHCFCLIQNRRMRTNASWKMHWLALKDRDVNNQGRLLFVFLCSEQKLGDDLLSPSESIPCSCKQYLFNKVILC